MNLARALLVRLVAITLMEPLAAAEPTDVNVSVHVGDTVEAVLIALNTKGFHVVYSNALVLPTMTLRTAPQASNIKELLHEILSPWQLHAVHTASGEWLIVSDGSNPKASPNSSTDVAPAEEVQPLDMIVVTGSRFGLATDGASNSFLDRKDVEQIPHLADDAMRVLKVLPGVSGGDFSAAFNIRGGRRDETMLLIDGAEIHNAVHFRDIDGAFSVLDTNLVQSINFITGGMTVDYGDYMSGVVDMRTHRASSDDEFHNAVGVSFVSAYARNSGTFSEGRGSWLVSARRGFLDLFAKMAENNGTQIVPRYTDIFSALNFDFNDRTSAAIHLLFSDDDLKFITDKSNDIDSAGRGHSLHAWVTVNHAWTENLHMDTVVATAALNLTRNQEGADSKRSGSVNSDNDFQFFDFHQDWSWQGSERYLPRWGFNANRQHADYDYALQVQINDPFVSSAPIDIAYGTKEAVGGTKFGAYGSLRTRITDSLTAEAGARWDTYRYPQHLTFNVVSPRINLVYAFNQRNVMHLAWSVMHQPQGIDQLQVEDNVTQFYGPERSRQVTVGYSRDLDRGWSLRFDVYNKSYSDLRPRFENALNPVQLIPEGSADRVRIDAPEAHAQGCELTLRRAVSNGLTGWMSVALAKAEDQEQGVWRPRTWEQQTTFSFGSSWTGVNWNISLAGTYHSGTPTTYLGAREVPTATGGTTLEGVVGPRNGERLGSYSRVDLRANRNVPLRSGKFSYYLEVTNLLNSKNECCIEDYGFKKDNQGNNYFFEERSYWLPILPSMGFQYEF